MKPEPLSENARAYQKTTIAIIAFIHGDNRALRPLSIAMIAFVSWSSCRNIAVQVVSPPVTSQASFVIARARGILFCRRQ